MIDNLLYHGFCSLMSIYDEAVSELKEPKQILRHPQQSLRNRQKTLRHLRMSDSFACSYTS